MNGNIIVINPLSWYSVNLPGKGRGVHLEVNSDRIIFVLVVILIIRTVEEFKRLDFVTEPSLLFNTNFGCRVHEHVLEGRGLAVGQ
jgi:hypothetical protein